MISAGFLRPFALPPWGHNGMGVYIALLPRTEFRTLAFFLPLSLFLCCLAKLIMMARCCALSLTYPSCSHRFHPVTLPKSYPSSKLTLPSVFPQSPIVLFFILCSCCFSPRQCVPRLQRFPIVHCHHGRSRTPCLMAPRLPVLVHMRSSGVAHNEYDAVVARTSIAHGSPIYLLVSRFYSHKHAMLYIHRTRCHRSLGERKPEIAFAFVASSRMETSGRRATQQKACPG